MRLGEELRARTLAGGLEHAAMVDADSGAQVGGVVAGEEHQVDVAAHLLSAAARRRYMLMHTHPGSSSFSPQDGLILIDQSALSSTLAIGANGTWYLLSKLPGVKPPESGELLFVYAIERERVRPAYVRRAVQGQLTPAAAQIAYIDEIWRNIAPLLMLRYDRVEPQT